MAAGGGSSRMPARLHSRSNFTTRSAQDDSRQLQRRWSLSQLSTQDETEPLLPARLRRVRPVYSALVARARDLVTWHRPSAPAPAAKLGTFAGVFVPTTLNVLSILMFLRFGLILGQSGLLGMLGSLLSRGLSLVSSLTRHQACWWLAMQSIF